MLFIFKKRLVLTRGEHGQDQDGDFFGSGLELDIHFWKNWIRTGSGYWFDFYNEFFLRVIQNVTNNRGSVFFPMIFILSVCAALITINGNSHYFIANFFRPSGSSELLLYGWYAALFVVLNGICVCCVGSYVCFMGGQLVFEWHQLENFLITRNRPVGNKATNTISHAKVEYHMCKYSAPSPLMHRQKAKCLLRLNHYCHAHDAIICRASL